MAPPKKRLPDKNFRKLFESDKGLNLTTLYFAEQAVIYLVDQGGFFPGTKAEFANAMGWLDGHGNPDRRRVENVCNLTRDQDRYPVAEQALAGYCIGYSEIQGGMALAEPHDSMSIGTQFKILQGDLTRQTAIKTQNRRRLPVWRATGASAANDGDHEMARLCWQAESEISSTGYVSDNLIGEFFKVLTSRGLVA